MEGQLYPQERELLYSTVKNNKPSICLESGTWKGGGSTLSISRGLYDNDHGILYTFEVGEEVHRQAVNSYKTEYPQLRQRISFNLMDFIEGVNQLDFDKIEFAFLDGAEDEDQNINQFKCIENLVITGGFVLFHDWKTLKCRKVKPYIESLTNWNIETVLDTETGMAKVVKL